MLLELTPAETAFLTAPSTVAEGFQVRLGRRLAATLTARLRLPVRATPEPAAASDGPPATPVWQPDEALSSLWLTRRLGGQRVMGTAAFVPHTLIRTLDAVLAESWLDEPVQTALPAALAWRIATDLTQATLAVQLPHLTTDMTRWARGAIRHG
ncbi:MAG: hypothetical protein M1449_11775 [Candidatus Thermoplasmatota archaeon]|nr:hypothetical protein [Candidatus Thermoplasmatota archaeon]